MRRMFHPTAVALAAIGLVGLAPQSFAAPAKTYDINVILPLTGGGAFLGKGDQTALRIAEGVINKDGGVHGQKVHFVFQDDQSNPQTAVQLTNQVVASKPAVLLGSQLVSTCNAMAPLVQNGPAMYCFSPGIHPPKGSYAFSSNVSTGDLASALIRYFRLKGWTKMAIMTSADATGQDAERMLNTVLAQPDNKDVKIVDRAHFNITDVSVAAQIEHIKEAKPQALIAWTTGSPVGTVFKGIIQAGLDIPVGTTDGNMTFVQMKDYAAFLPKRLYMPSAEWVQPPGVVKLDPAVEKAQKEFFDAFKAANIKPDHGSTLAWDPAMIVIAALRHLPPGASAAQVRNYIAQLKGFGGFNGLYDFTKVPQRGLDINDVVVTQWSPTDHNWNTVGGPTGTPLGK